MRRFLALALIFIMLTPSLVCAMPVCVDTQKTVKAEKPCEGHGKHRVDDAQSKQVSFMQDCAGVDFQLTSAPTLEKPDAFKIFFTAFDLPATAQQASNASFVRGPPLELVQGTENHRPVYLTTQRIRI